MDGCPLWSPGNIPILYAHTVGLLHFPPQFCSPFHNFSWVLETFCNQLAVVNIDCNRNHGEWRPRQLLPTVDNISIYEGEARFASSSNYFQKETSSILIINSIVTQFTRGLFRFLDIMYSGTFTFLYLNCLLFQMNYVLKSQNRPLLRFWLILPFFWPFF